MQPVYGVTAMRTKVLVVGLGLVLSLPVSAVNWNFLRYAPTNHFTEQDWELLRQAGREALAQGADGDIQGWNNPDTGAYGTIQPLDTTEREGMTCRRVVIYNNAGGASGTSRFTFCKQEDGTWRVAQ
jgi:surface antigen